MSFTALLLPLLPHLTHYQYLAEKKKSVHRLPPPTYPPPLALLWEPDANREPDDDPAGKEGRGPGLPRPSPHACTPPCTLAPNYSWIYSRPRIRAARPAPFLPQRPRPPRLPGRAPRGRHTHPPGPDRTRLGAPPCAPRPAQHKCARPVPRRLSGPAGRRGPGRHRKVSRVTSAQPARLLPGQPRRGPAALPPAPAPLGRQAERGGGEWPAAGGRPRRRPAAPPPAPPAALLPGGAGLALPRAAGRARPLGPRGLPARN